MFSGMSSWPVGAPLCAAATIDSTGAISTIAALGNQPSFIIPPVNAGHCHAAVMLNPSLAAALASQIAQRHPDQEGVPAPRVAACFIVAPPGQAKLDAIVIVEDAEPVADRLEAVGERERILAAIGEIDHGGAEDGPVAREAHAPAEPDLLAVAQILDRGIDVAVQPQITDRRIGPPPAHGRVNLVAAGRQAVLVEPEAVDEADQPADLDRGAPDDVG